MYKLYFIYSNATGRVTGIAYAQSESEAVFNFISAAADEIIGEIYSTQFRAVLAERQRGFVKVLYSK